MESIVNSSARSVCCVDVIIDIIVKAILKSIKTEKNRKEKAFFSHLTLRTVITGKRGEEKKGKEDGKKRKGKKER